MAAIVVLGCRLSFDRRTRRLRGAAARRAARAGDLYRSSRTRASLVVASGGRAWFDVVEADALAAELVAGGVPPARILRERWSHSTRENAFYVAGLLKARGIAKVELVTCAFHVPRARSLFEGEGLDVEAIPAAGELATGFGRLYQWGREGVATWLDRR